MINHAPIAPQSSSSDPDTTLMPNESPTNNNENNNEHIQNISDEIMEENNKNVNGRTTTTTVSDHSSICCGNDAILFNELKDFGNSLNSVERLVKKLSLMDNRESGNIEDLHHHHQILRESVKIRPLIIDEESCKEIERNEETAVYYRRFSTEADLQPVIDLITKDLSEPYSIYTYRYFIYNWPRMCIMAFGDDGRCVGAIVGKTESHHGAALSSSSVTSPGSALPNGERVRGYIAMLAVQKEYRRRLIGSRLVELVIDTMIDAGCSEVVLETEITNKSALSLYEKLGFIRDKRLFRYYLNGVDAFRLKLWMS